MSCIDGKIAGNSTFGGGVMVRREPFPAREDESSTDLKIFLIFREIMHTFVTSDHIKGIK